MTTMTTNELYEAALAGLTIQRERLDAKMYEIRLMLSNYGFRAQGAMETEKAPVTLHKATWVRSKWTVIPDAAKRHEHHPRKKRKVSAEGRRRMAEAQKRRWATKGKKAKKA